MAAKRGSRQECATLERSKRSGYSRPASLFIKRIYPLYSQFFPLLKLQNLFLDSDFLDCNYLVLCRKTEGAMVIDGLDNEKIV